MSRDSSDLWVAALNQLNEEDRKLVDFDGQRKLDILSDLGQLVSNAKENSIKERWRFHRPGDGQTVILRDLFSKIAVWIDRFKEVGDIVVQYDPVHAALPWAGVRFLLQLAVSDINKFAFVVEGAETIARSISRHATFEQIYLHHDTIYTRAIKGLEEAVVKLYAANLIYLAKAKKYFEEPTLSSNTLTEQLMSLSIDQHDRHTKLQELLRSIDSPICRMSSQLDSLDDQLKHSERMEILRWVSSQPYLDHHQQVKKKALSGSGQWLLQDPLYIQWYKQSVSSLLWLHGKPGSGKSTLVSLVIEDMVKRFRASQSALPVYFYCARTAAEPERSNPNAVLASILRQLSCVQPDAPLLSPVIEKYKRHGEGFKSKGLDIEDSRDLIVRLVEDYDMSIVVVDALDECDPNMRQDLLDAFEHILKESAGLVKIFVSSRNDQDIVYTLRGYPNLDIVSNMNTADIQAYVKVETQKLVKSGQLLRNSRAKEEMTALIVDRVSSGADGMFRWASLQLDVLRALKRDEDIRRQLGRLPPKLEQLYLEVYNNLISLQGEVGRSIIDNTLKWLLCAKEKLRASKFLIAIAANLNTSDGDVSADDLLELCNNLVVYDESLDVFRFAHLSVREFLEKRPEFAEVSCYILAAECCLLQIIASSNCPNTEHLMSDTHRLRLRGSSDWTESSIFLMYANSSCMEYCKSIPQSNRSDDTAFGRTFQFLLSDKLGSNSPLNAWVQWYRSHILDDLNSAASVKFQEFLTNCSDSLSRSFLVATYFGFSEVVTACLRDRELGDGIKDKGLLLAAMTAQHEAVEILGVDREDWAMTEPMLSYAILAWDKDGLASRLDKIPDTMITHRVIHAVIEAQDDGKLAILLDRYSGLKITKELLDVATFFSSEAAFRLLLARAVNPVITERTIWVTEHLSTYPKPIVDACLENMRVLIDKVGVPQHLMSFAARYGDERIIEVMLKNCAPSIITADSMVNAAERGREVFLLMLEYGGKITDTVLDRMASSCDAQIWEVLLEQGYGSSINVKRLKLAAHNSDDAVLSIHIDYVEETALTNEFAELIGEVARWGQNDAMRQLLDRAKDTKISQDLLLAAILNPHPHRLDRVIMFMERSREVSITEDMLLTAAGDEQDGFELIQMFLERDDEAKISDHVLMAAACNRRQGNQIMRLFLEKDRAADLTRDVLICVAQYSNLELVLEVLECSEARVIMGRLLEAAAANVLCGGELVELLLARAEIADFPEDLFIEALGNFGQGAEVISVLEKRFGRIHVTESLMAKCIHRATVRVIRIELLLSRTDPAQITKEILISAIGKGSDYPNYLSARVAEKALHIPITADLLGVAAELGSADVFRFLWSRYSKSSVSEDLINAAVRNLLFARVSIFEFLLHEASRVEIGEETLIAIVGNRLNGYEFCHLLLQQGLQADTTEGVPETLLENGGIKVNCKSPNSLQLSYGTKITRDMFKIAASVENGGVLQALSEFCGLEGIPKICLEILELQNAVFDTDLLKNLIERGVEPDIASPNGETPLVTAARCGEELAVQMLLSAGALPDGGPMLKYSPLCRAAEVGDYDIARLLVNAGASIHFRDEEGRTPSMIAKENRKFRVFKYLEQCRVKEEEGEGEIPMST
ncbi:MAG: hypothetical protein Q9161_007706 [Pseudevernia consocians]